MSLPTVEVHTYESLMALCADAAAYAVRPPYTYADRADCAADIFGDILGAVARDIAPTTEAVMYAPTRCDHGRPSDVLAWIDRAEAEAPRRAESVMPLTTDERTTWSAVRNRAMNWRRAEDARRERDALMSGRDRAEDARDECPADYLTVGAAQDREAARRAASEACRDLGIAPGTREAPSPVWCVFYQWTRGLEPAEAAEELSLSHDAMRQRMSRAGKIMRGALSATQLAEYLTGGRTVNVNGETVYSLRDDSAEAPHHWAKDLAEYWQGAEDRARREAEAPTVRTLKTAPDPNAAARREAAQADRERRRAHASRVLGAMPRRPVHAGTGARADAIGRTAGKAPERFASRQVRLGRD